MPKGKKTHQTKLTIKDNSTPYKQLPSNKKAALANIILAKHAEGIEKHVKPYLEGFFDYRFNGREDLKQFFLYRVCNIADLGIFYKMACLIKMRKKAQLS